MRWRVKNIVVVIKTYLDKVKDARDITFDDINTAVYSTAVTIKEHLKDIKYAKVLKEGSVEPK